MNPYVASRSEREFIMLSDSKGWHHTEKRFF
jgi:hypothetical protein